jgi:hypothetical protein
MNVVFESDVITLPESSVIVTASSVFRVVILAGGAIPAFRFVVFQVADRVSSLTMIVSL